VQTAVDEIVRGILSAHIQAVLKYAVELDDAVKNSKDSEEPQVGPAPGCLASLPCNMWAADSSTPGYAGPGFS
jgi:hypothetical protein